MLNEPHGEVEPPDRTRVADWAYDRLRLMILNNELTPGTRLSVPALAERLSVSRSPVREGVLRLIREGLAEEIPHRGAAVSSITPEDLVAVYQVREVLDSLAARLAAENVTPRLVAQLEVNLSAHEQVIAKGGDLGRHVTADVEFHTLIRDAANNRWLTDYLAQIQGQIRLAMATTSLSAGMAIALEEHRRIFDAIKAGDPSAAEAAAGTHVHRLRKTLLRDPQPAA